MIGMLQKEKDGDLFELLKTGFFKRMEAKRQKSATGRCFLRYCHSDAGVHLNTDSGGKSGSRRKDETWLQRYVGTGQVKRAGTDVFKRKFSFHRSDNIARHSKRAQQDTACEIRKL